MYKLHSQRSDYTISFRHNALGGIMAKSEKRKAKISLGALWRKEMV